MKIYLAVKKEIKEGKENLGWLLQEKMLWALQQRSVESLKIIITHVYVPSKTINPSENGQRDRENVERRLDKYLALCSQQKVQAEILVHTAENVVKGLVELIDLYQIAKLVMGAAADQRYKKKMNLPTSRTACSVSLFADRSCDIWFVCKGNLVSRRERLLYLSQTSERRLLKCQSEVSSSDANLLKLDVSLIASLLASTSFPKEQAELLGHNEEKSKENDSDAELSNKLREALAEVENLKNKINNEAQRNQKLERDANEALKLKQKYEYAIKEVEKLHQKSDMASTSSIQGLENFSEFSKSEIDRSTKNYSDKIGEGGFGCVYKGQIWNTVVAVKMLNPKSLQGRKEFHHEVAILGRVRHPNIVTLIGACSETCTVIYEFLPNGSLAERLKCKNNTPPLTWRARTRIAIEICSALTFLHSNSPPIVHGDLKPENILLDANLVGKLGDFGLCRLLQQSSSSGTTVVHLSDKLYGTRPYMDPEYIKTGELTIYSDVYAFGIVILQLITGKGPDDTIDILKRAVEKRQFHTIIDRDAGPWPYVQARKLINLGLKCCEISRRNRPDLVEGVWNVLKNMLPISSELAMDDGLHVPDYFICPITMDIMDDPHIAADGFTYEAKAIKEWFNTGRNTSPVTNNTLTHHELIRNLALRSDIKEWLQKHKRA